MGGARHRWRMIKSCELQEPMVDMSISSISLSGLEASQSALDAAASNVANLETPRYRRQMTVQSELPAGGTTSTIRTASAPGSDLPADIVGELQAGIDFAANMLVFRTEESMLGSLIDIQG